MVPVGDSGRMMAIGHGMLMPGRSHDSLRMPSRCNAFLRTLQKHGLERVCALDVEFDPAVKEVASDGHQADGEPLAPIMRQGLFQLLRVGGVTVGDSFRGSPDKYQAQTATDEVTNPKKQSAYVQPLRLRGCAHSGMIPTIVLTPILTGIPGRLIPLSKNLAQNTTCESVLASFFGMPLNS